MAAPHQCPAGRSPRSSAGTWNRPEPCGSAGTDRDGTRGKCWEGTVQKVWGSEAGDLGSSFTSATEFHRNAGRSPVPPTRKTETLLQVCQVLLGTHRILKASPYLPCPDRTDHLKLKSLRQVTALWGVTGPPHALIVSASVLRPTLKHASPQPRSAARGSVPGTALTFPGKGECPGDSLSILGVHLTILQQWAEEFLRAGRPQGAGLGATLGKPFPFPVWLFCGGMTCHIRRSLCASVSRFWNAGADFGSRTTRATRHRVPAAFLPRGFGKNPEGRDQRTPGSAAGIPDTASVFPAPPPGRVHHTPG